jgi:hypothetical protein
MEKGYDIVMFGHTHVEHLETIGPTTYLNPGSLAYPRESRDGTFVLMEFDQHGKPFFARNTLPRSEKKKRFIW